MKYENPSMEIVLLKDRDVVTASQNGDGTDYDGWD